jgi:hypothetical protein
MEYLTRFDKDGNEWRFVPVGIGYTAYQLESDLFGNEYFQYVMRVTETDIKEFTEKE